MELRPYFCPNCRSNRVKFSLVTHMIQEFRKDAITGEVLEEKDTQQLQEVEPTIQCNVCGFQGNEMRFIKQAEREPRPFT